MKDERGVEIAEGAAKTKHQTQQTQSISFGLNVFVVNFIFFTIREYS